MNDREKILLTNAIDYIHETTGYDEKEIAMTLIGLTEEEWKEIKENFQEENK